MDKKIYVTRPSLPPKEEYFEELSDIWHSGIMTHQGPKHMQLENELKDYLQATNISLFSSGHQALEIGIAALEMTGEVITTPFTFISTIQAILRNGLRPVFCDINFDDYTMDVTKIESLITEKTCAILPVHVYGNICAMEKIQEIADRHGLKVIYDAAHSFGELYKGKHVSDYGDMTMFSFHATKVFNTVEGGALVYKDPKIRQKVEGIRQFGQILLTDEIPYIGTNAKLTEAHAAMGICNLKHFQEYILLRKAVVETYIEELRDIPGIKIVLDHPDAEFNYSYFPVVFEEKEAGVTRDMVLNKLSAEGIYARKYFYPLCCDYEVCTSRDISSDVPVSRYVSERVLCLPCYSDLAIDDVKRICKIIKDLYWNS